MAQQNGPAEINPIVSGILSLIIVGLGHIVINKQTVRGAVWLLITLGVGFIFGIIAFFTLGFGLILFPLLLVFPIGAAIDAYVQAGKINSGEVQV